MPYLASATLRVFWVLVLVSSLLGPGLSDAVASEAEGEESHHKFVAGLFLGATHAHGKNEATLALEAGYNFHPQWTVGGIVERAEREVDTTLFLAAVG